MTDNKEKKKSDNPQKDAATSTHNAWEKFRKEAEDVLENTVEGYDQWDKGHRDDSEKGGPTP